MAVLPSLLPPDHARINRGVTKFVVSNPGPVADQIELYRGRVGQYPTRLKDLTTRPADPSLAVAWGNKPYIEDARRLLDAWGNPLQYRVPGVHNAGSFDLWSMGPDGVSGTADDIGNW